MTIELILNIAKISQYLALTNATKNGFASGGVEIQLPTKIYNIRKSVEWRYNIDNEEDAALRATANYLFSLCAPYSLEAQLFAEYPYPGEIAPFINYYN